MSDTSKLNEPLCPFYGKKNPDKLYCEGATVKFPDRTAGSDWVRDRCASEYGYKNCPIYEMLMSYYEERKYKNG